MASMIHFYRTPGGSVSQLLSKVQGLISKISDIQSEYCYNVESASELTQDDIAKLTWLFSETFEPKNFSRNSFFINNKEENSCVIEVGPRLAFSTAFSSNCLSMCLACGIDGLVRIERSRRYKIEYTSSLTLQEVKLFTDTIHDRMTECVYSSRLESFANGVLPEKVTTIPILAQVYLIYHNDLT